MGLDAEKEALEALGPAAGMIVLVTEAGPHDPRTIAAHERLSALASGEVLLLVSAPAAAAEGAAA